MEKAVCLIRQLAEQTFDQFGREQHTEKDSIAEMGVVLMKGTNKVDMTKEDLDKNCIKLSFGLCIRSGKP